MYLPKPGNTKAGIIILLIILIAINWLASLFHARIDLTNEKRFTLSNSTRKLLREIKEPVTIDVFLKGNYPSGFKKLGESANDLLDEFREIGGKNIQFNFISPEEKMGESETSYGDSLSALGLYPINLTSQVKEGQQQQYVYPVALVHHGGKTIPLRLYEGKTPLINYQELNSSEALLEYKFADAISRAARKELPVIGYAVGNGEPTQLNTYDLVENTLSQDYKLFTINLNTQPTIPREFKALVIVKPTIAFTEEAKLKLDQYVMNGGKLIMFIDRLDAEMDSLQLKNEVIAYDRDLKLNDLLFRYGVRINADLLMDLQCDYLPFDVNGNGQFELLPWNYFPVLENTGSHPIVKNLGYISGRFVNSIDTVGSEGITKTVLLHSSANARTIGTPAIISGRENVNASENEKYKTSAIPVAILLEGKFSSLYSNRLSASMRDSLGKAGETFLPSAVSTNKMIIVADGDIVLNSVTKGSEPIPMGMNPYTYGTQREFPFDNRAFLQNSLDYLIDLNNLAEAKAKDYSVQLLDQKLVEKQRSAWQIVNIAVPILIIIILAVILQWLRKRTYTKQQNDNG